MSLSYHFSFAAPPTATAKDLEVFLMNVERFAESLGFSPTTVLNVVFDNKERREFARRLGGGVYFEHEKLRGVAMPSPEDVANYDQESGSCRLVPRQAVVLVVTDENECETCFGFMKYPPLVRDIDGRPIVETGMGEGWVYRNFVDMPDKRYRQIVERFAKAGYLKEADDEYTPKAEQA